MKEFFFKIALAVEEPPGDGGLIPCGNGATDDCTLTDLGNLVGSVFDFLIVLVVPLAILGIAIGGLYMIIGSTNPSTKSEGQSIIYYSILGLVLAVAAWVIVNTILVGLGAKGFNNPLEGGIF